MVLVRQLRIELNPQVSDLLYSVNSFSIDHFEMSSSEKSKVNDTSTTKSAEDDDPTTAIGNDKKIQETDAKHEEPSSSSGSTVHNLYNRFVTSFEQALGSIQDTSQKKQKLENLTLEGVAEYIKEKQLRNIVFMVGAGISTSAGIPDFRSPGTGLYDNLEKYNLPDPQAIFEIGFFKKNPEPFFTLARELFPEKLKPTPCHYFIRLMDEKGLMRRCYTQNIDSLEYISGIKTDKVVTAHGSHHTNTCLSCHKKYNVDWITAKLKDKNVPVPKCEVSGCDGVVKPDIVFFGESLPKRFFTCAISDFPKCDLLIIMGTSLVVQPFAGMVHEVGDDVPRLLINLTEAGRVSRVERAIGLPGLCYDEEENLRDVFWKGTCDDGAWKLAELLGWKSELKSLMEREWAKIDREKLGT
uniref:Deacetylase sirtuin-type domain-containing protein n=1 Tax=Acrobeloides nanus TaxID=290746 RepID=A0A914CCM7_9BILA